MKIAVSSTGEGLGSSMDPRFGRAPYFVIIEEDEAGKLKEAYAVENPAAQAAMGAGTEAAQRVLKEGVQAVISGSVGPNAYEIFEKTGTDVFLSRGEESVEETYKRYKNGQLRRMTMKRL